MWLYNTAAALAARQMSCYTQYHYEDLARSPQETLTELCRAMRIDEKSQMLQPNAASDVERELATVWNNSPTDNISTTSIGRYRTEMDDITYTLFCHVRLTQYAASKLGVDAYSALDVLQQLGYDAPSPRRSMRWLRGALSSLKDHALRNARRLRHYHQLAPPLTTISVH